MSPAVIAHHITPESLVERPTGPVNPAAVRNERSQPSDKKGGTAGTAKRPPVPSGVTARRVDVPRGCSPH